MTTALFTAAGWIADTALTLAMRACAAIRAWFAPPVGTQGWVDAEFAGIVAAYHAQEEDSCPPT